MSKRNMFPCVYVCVCVKGGDGLLKHYKKVRFKSTLLRSWEVTLVVQEKEIVGFPFFGSFPKCLQQMGLGNAETRDLELCLCFPRGDWDLNHRQAEVLLRGGAMKAFFLATLS